MMWTCLVTDHTPMAWWYWLEQNEQPQSKTLPRGQSESGPSLIPMWLSKGLLGIRLLALGSSGTFNCLLLSVLVQC